MTGRAAPSAAPRAAARFDPPPLREPAALDAVEREADRRADAALRGPDLAGPQGLSRAGARGPGFAGLGQGRPLPAALGRRLSAGLGVDLAPLRLHDDGPARATAAGMGARAAIRGGDVVLGPGEDAARPESAALIAHEAAHFAQAATRADLPAVLREGGGTTGVGRAPPRVPFETGAGQGPEDRAVLFGLDQAEITPTARAALRAFAEAQVAPVHVDVYGYASTEGAEAYNLNLSAHRAAAVRRLLQPLLPQGSEIRLHAHGEIDSFGPPEANRRAGVSANPRALSLATPPRLPGLPRPSLVPPVGRPRPSLGIPPLTLGAPPSPEATPDTSPEAETDVPSPDAETAAPALPLQFRLRLDAPLTLRPDDARRWFGSTPAAPGRGLDYLPLARSAALRGLHLPSLMDRGELESAYALHRRLYPWIPESGDDVDNWLLGKIVGAMTAQAATERALDAHLEREYPGPFEEFERRAQIDRAMRGVEEPFVIPPITVFELYFDITLGEIGF